jgi:oligoendopeptidase F
VQDTWDLSGVFPSVEAWDAAMKAAEADADKLGECKGHLSDRLRPCMEAMFANKKAVMRAYVYASNLSNADTRDAAWQGRSAQAEHLYVHFGEATSFVAPEILAMGSVKVEAAIQADAGLAPYDYFLRSTVRNAPHTLSAEGEAILAATGVMQGSPGQIEGILVDAELPWPDVTFSDGKTVRLDPSAWTLYRAQDKREDRIKAFDAFYGALHAYQGTLGATLDASTQAHWFMAKQRHYATSVAAAIDVDHVPPEVYTTLVATTNKNLPTLHRYLKLRAQMLGIKDLAYHDMYPPLVSLEKSYTLDEAEAMTLEAVKPLGADYVAGMKAGFGARWMDAYPHEGKRSGAYMDGSAYEVHPFLLMNFNGDYESVSTLAHEWGHAMHSVLSSRTQPYAKADYSTFIAEIASTFNEHMLLQQVLRSTKSDEEKLFFLGTQLENLRTTYFRQAQFAEFELAIHDQVEHGQPLTGEGLSATYLEILKRYYGDKEGVTHISDRDGAEWAYIPHFYYNFYVYQYATSIAASAQLSADVLAKKPGALERYITLLSSGGKDDGYVLLKTAGVDLATPAPYDAIATRMNDIMDQMESIMAKRAKAGVRKR